MSQLIDQSSVSISVHFVYNFLFLLFLRGTIDIQGAAIQLSYPSTPLNGVHLKTNSNTLDNTLSKHLIANLAWFWFKTFEPLHPLLACISICISICICTCIYNSKLATGQVPRWPAMASASVSLHSQEAGKHESEVSEYFCI